MNKKTLDKIIDLCTEGGDSEIALTKILRLSLMTRKSLKPQPPKSRTIVEGGTPDYFVNGMLIDYFLGLLVALFIFGLSPI